MLDTSLGGRRQRTNSVTRRSSGRGEEQTEDKQRHPVEMEQREREPSAMGGVMESPTGPQHKPMRASEQGTVPTRVSAQSLLTMSDGKSFQMSSIISWRWVFCLPGVKKVNRASMTLESGTWCHQELLHI